LKGKEKRAADKRGERGSEKDKATTWFRLLAQIRVYPRPSAANVFAD
jgi:hypothetical protein